MKYRMSLILPLSVLFFCFALTQAFGQTQTTPTPTPNDPDNVDLQQEGQFGPGSTMDSAGVEASEIAGAKDALEAETSDATPQSALTSSPNSLVAQHNVDANIDVKEVLGADLNEPH